MKSYRFQEVESMRISKVALAFLSLCVLALLVSIVQAKVVQTIFVGFVISFVIYMEV